MVRTRENNLKEKRQPTVAHSLGSVIVWAKEQKIWNTTSLQFKDAVTRILKFFSETDSVTA